MSRGGRVQLTSTPARMDCSDLIRDVIRELQPAASQAINFYLEGLADLLLAPIETSSQQLEVEVRAAGRQRIASEVEIPRDQHEALRAAIMQSASALEVDLPDALAIRPAFVSARMVAIQEEALRVLQASDADDPEGAARVREFAEAIEREQSLIEAAFEDAALVAGQFIGQPVTAVFEQFADLVSSVDVGSDGPLAQTLHDLAAEAGQQIRAETEEAWSLVALAASMVALERADFVIEAADAGEGRVTARDLQSDTGQIVVSANPESGQIEYETTGYEGDACAGPEARFLSSLASVLGAEITASNLTHWALPSQPADRRAGPSVGLPSTETTRPGGLRDRLRDDRRKQSPDRERER